MDDVEMAPNHETQPVPCAVDGFEAMVVVADQAAIPLLDRLDEQFPLGREIVEDAALDDAGPFGDFADQRVVITLFAEHEAGVLQDIGGALFAR